MKRISIKFRDEIINMSLPEFGMISAIVSVADWAKKQPNETERATLELGGLDSTDGKHPKWGTFDLSAGDKVIIEIHDDRLTDPPIERTGPSMEQIKELEREYIRKRAMELGWTISESDSTG